MKQKIKDFFTQKRCKKLLNNKGFSLLEVLVAVSYYWDHFSNRNSTIYIPEIRTKLRKLLADTTTISNISKSTPKLSLF